jgi:hypothetical protein
LFFYYSKKLRQKIIGRTDDADTDSYSDEDFDIDEEALKLGGAADEKEKLKVEHNNIELLEKRLNKILLYVIIKYVF